MNWISKIVLLAVGLMMLQSLNAQEITQVCSVCKGRGTQECSLCDGKGKWKAEIEGKKKKTECPHCKGTETQHCWLCDGTGKEVAVVSPNTSADHPEGYSWLWCSTCKHHGVTSCSRCGGRGVVYTSDGEPSICGLCDGKRYVLCSSCQGTCGWYAMRERCEVCEGNGTITCNQCNGKGWLPPEQIEKAVAEVCKFCKGHGILPHKECEGKGCKHCKNGKVKCKDCDGRGAVVIKPEPRFRDCYKCNRKGVMQCTTCSGRGYRNITIEGISK